MFHNNKNYINSLEKDIKMVYQLDNGSLVLYIELTISKPIHIKPKKLPISIFNLKLNKNLSNKHN